MRILGLIVIVAAVVLASGCSSTSMAKDFNGLTTPDGKATHVSTTNIAVHMLFSKPVWGNATLEETVSCCTKAAKDDGASKIRIVQSDVTTYWWVLPPISFVIHPVVSNVAGDAIR
jgi:hypothetical protein